MRVVIFTHSLLSDWNHSNAHFLRGLASEFVSRGVQVGIYEPRDSWSHQNLVQAHGDWPIRQMHWHYPNLHCTLYDASTLDLDSALEDADLVIVHEWNPHDLVARLGRHRTANHYQLLFHDTYHRTVTEPECMSRYDLRNYDGVLAAGAALRDIYLNHLGVSNAWTWHEAADIRRFYPKVADAKDGDLVWIGNWGEGERTDEIREFLLEPVKELGLKAVAYGVGYPDEALADLADVGIEYRGWIPNFRVPDVFSRYRATVHIPRRPYATKLPGVPAIRLFEALSCGIPLVSAPWQDSQNLFRAGTDYLVARSGTEMAKLLAAVLSKPDCSQTLVRNGLETIRARHTCAHRVDELMAIHDQWKRTQFAPEQINTACLLGA